MIHVYNKFDKFVFNYLKNMEINSLLATLLLEDICTEMQGECQIDPAIIRKIVSDKIRDKDISFDIPVKETKRCIVGDKDRCKARIWDHKRGTRCKSKSKGDGYCGKHLNCIQSYGHLLFGDHDEPRPIINEKGNVIPWYDDPPLEVLEILIRFQRIRLQKLIKTTETN
jgi:hypothetical protein